MKLQQPDAAIFNLSSSAVSYPSSSSSSSSSSSMSKVFKLLQPLALELPAAASGIEPASSLHLKCFRSPKASSPNHHQHASRSGGTRWNPTEEQIRKLESLYRSGMRTPNAQQIEKITSELASHGRIEGKNVFYWFQNHKARERQKLKLKRNPALLRRRHSVLDSNSHSPEANSISDAKACAPALDLDGRRTLKLFPLQPENINDGRLI